MHRFADAPVEPNKLSAIRTVPIATLALIVATAAVFVPEFAAGGMTVCETWGFVAHRFLVTGNILPVFSYPLLHDPFDATHLLGNVVLLGIFGALVERQMGAVRMLAVYVAAAVAGALGHLLVTPGATEPLVGNSGCVFALLAIVAANDPRALAFVALLFASNLVALVYPAFSLVPATTSIGCHVGGFTCGAAVVLLTRARGVRVAGPRAKKLERCARSPGARGG